jgi:glycosyltransferase involved in cell wall biosynthesis
MRAEARTEPGRVAIFAAHLGAGGAERAMLNLAGGLAERGCRVDLVLSRAEGDYLGAVPGSVRIVDLGAGRVIASLPRLVRYLRRERPASMLACLNYVNIVALWARRLARVPTRLVVNEQNTLSLDAPLSSRRRHRLLPALAARFYPWADGIVAVSQGSADDLARTARLSPDRIQVIHNPIVTPDLRRLADAPVKHPWFAPGEPPVVLAVGRLSAQKDFRTLIRAFGLLTREREARLVVLGEGSERPALETLVADLGLQGAVDLHGRVGNPYAYMSRAAAFVLSSRYEGLPSVLIEALFCGVPIVATDCPSGPAEILQGGAYGRLVPVGDISALAAGLDAALAGRVPRPAEASWRPYEQGSVVGRYMDVLAA